MECKAASVLNKPNAEYEAAIDEIMKARLHSKSPSGIARYKWAGHLRLIQLQIQPRR